MQQSCRQCSAGFEVTDDDLAFLQKVSPVIGGVRQDIPAPTLCPECRLRRRLAYRNMIYVYRATSALTGQPIFSRFPPTVSFPLMENDRWYGGEWDAFACGRAFDPSRPFFAQLRDLRDAVPHRCLSLTRTENSEYCNNNSDLKNCYFVFGSTYSEDCMYLEFSQKCKDCIDCSISQRCELCAGCTACNGCYNVQESEFSEDCSDSMYLSYCRSCKDCFGCANLRHKQYCVWNEQKTREEYEAFMRAFRRESRSARQECRATFRAFADAQPRPHCQQRQTEECTGNFLNSARNVTNSFFVSDGEDIKNGFSLYDGTKDSRDFSYFGMHSELIYECVQCGMNDQRVLFSFDSWDGNSDLLYCLMCNGCSDCFGCVGLQKKRHCVFNVQYSPEDYAALVATIIAHMRTTGEWGEYLPVEDSPVPYNHSVAQRYFPMTKDDVQATGGGWYEKPSEHETAAIDADALPDGLPLTDDPIIVRSARSGKAFKITAPEIKRYRRLGMPLPRLTYDERMEERATLFGGIRLYERTCAKTGVPIATAYPPESPYVIWDRDVYEREFGS